MKRPFRLKDWLENQNQRVVNEDGDEVYILDCPLDELLNPEESGVQLYLVPKDETPMTKFEEAVCEAMGYPYTTKDDPDWDLIKPFVERLRTLALEELKPEE